VENDDGGDGTWLGIFDHVEAGLRLAVAGEDGLAGLTKPQCAVDDQEDDHYRAALAEKPGEERLDRAVWGAPVFEPLFHRKQLSRRSTARCD